MKALFLVGQCIRLLNYDVWEVPTYKIVEVGKHSYNVRQSEGFKADPIRFSDQKRFTKVECSEK